MQSNYISCQNIRRKLFTDFSLISSQRTHTQRNHNQGHIKQPVEVLAGLKERECLKDENISRLTSMDTLQRVEEGHKQVHENSQIEGDAAPE